MNPEDLIELVKDEKSFLEFAEALRKDRELSDAEEAKNPSNQYGPTSQGWENGSIHQFLEAAIAWAEDSGFGRRVGIENVSPWRLFAQFLLAGKTYE